ncbi:RNA 2',3'-cyclic phosphodiesterase [Candidatus Woesearchaeota archaeon]|nr:RNA 2',3'-cyclic phosphodiesterase [Candidatus Woesearchaeota archaeon]
MRCFFAIPLSDEVKDYLYELMYKLKNDLRGCNLKIRFVPKKNLHITLMFLGEIKEDKLEEVKNKAREIQFKPFKFNISHIGVFPNESVVKVLWVGINPVTDVLKLQREIDESLLGAINRDNEFKAHITMARVGYSKQTYKLISEIKKINVKNIGQEVTSFGLYRSELHRDGSKYFTIGEFKTKKV